MSSILRKSVAAASCRCWHIHLDRSERQAACSRLPPVPGRGIYSGS